jgi:acyl carrier protein phosphodiesterase
LRRLTNYRTGFALAGGVVDHRRTREILIYPEVRASRFQAPSPELEKLAQLNLELPFDARRAVVWRQLHPVSQLQSWRTPAESHIFSHLAAHDRCSR